MIPRINLLSSPKWQDYELLDSGDGQKLERFGPYTFVRPEVQALWHKTLLAETWRSADAVFKPSGEESGGHWVFNHPINENWEMNYPLAFSDCNNPFVSRFQGREGGRGESAQNGYERVTPFAPESKEKRAGVRELHFNAMTTPGRHLGVFPECAVNWDWMVEKVLKRLEQVNILNLFGYTGLATLAVAAAGAKVTHVDASKKSIAWARQNQALSGLQDKPIRWIMDDALKFVAREGRRGVKYDGILLDPPKFGRGPKGEVWEVYQALPQLLSACRAVLSETPLFAVLTVYAVKFPAIHANQALAEMVTGLEGELECGELVTEEKNTGRLLSQAVFARWEAPIK
jgi:23S rRNA (cytosine1962-C5)-methyltransferase